MIFFITSGPGFDLHYPHILKGIFSLYKVEISDLR